jgi:hypothetical protein
MSTTIQLNKEELLQKYEEIQRKKHSTVEEGINEFLTQVVRRQEELDRQLHIDRQNTLTNNYYFKRKYGNLVQ